MIVALLNYLKNMKTQKIILWCYFIWYLTVIGFYFEASLKLWANSVGISLIIGFALILSTTQQGVKQDIWVKVRLFLFPFCVSSYSATIKDYDFILLFPSDSFHLFISTLNCLIFLLVIWCIKTFYHTNKIVNQIIKKAQ